MGKLCRAALACCLAGALVPGPARADDLSELKARVEAQERQIQELKQLLQQKAVGKPEAEKSPSPAKAPPPPAPGPDEKTVNALIDTYLKDHPGAGMPAGVQQGWDGNGFVFRSPLKPSYSNWEDECRVPFTLRVRGRLQAGYYFYKATDSVNHLADLDTGTNTAADFSQLEVKRARVYFDGTLFDPNLRYNITFDGTTRGLASLSNGNGVVGTGGSNSSVVVGPTSQTTTVIGGGVPGGNSNGTVDHAVRLFNAFVAYDFHPVGSQPGTGMDCPDGGYRYAPTWTLFVGKVQPFFCLDHVLGSGTDQFVEFSMASWFFDADDDNEQTGAGGQVRAFDDRLFGQLMITNGNETQTANLQMDNLPGVQVSAWYDLGGTWDERAKRWLLFGDGIPDVDYSCNPVARVGFATNLVPEARRSLYTAAELNRIRVTSPAPGGTTILALLSGGGRNQNVSAAGVSPFSLDAVDSYTYDVFWAGKWRGFSLYNEWWLRDLNNFRALRSPTVGGAATTNGTGVNNPILYNSTVGGAAAAALFPQNRGLIDYGFTLQSGYFLIPRKLEIAGRWSWVRGQSGNINGDGTFTTVTLPGVQGGAVRVVNNAFKEFSEADEFAVGLNYYFYRHMVKWQTDFSVYTGAGNPAQGGQSAATFIPGVNGYQVRSQIQLQF